MFFESKNVDLLKYLPFFMQEYREIEKIMKSEEPEFKLLWEKIKIVFGNQFISFCDEKGIEKFEKMLKINNDENLSLEFRIFRVLTYWNAKVPLTWRFLVEKMNQLCESPKNYELNLDNNNYELNITTRFDNEKKYVELNNMLKTVIPANLGIKSINILNQSPKLDLKLNVGVVIDYKYII